MIELEVWSISILDLRLGTLGYYLEHFQFGLYVYSSNSMFARALMLL